MGQYDNNPPPYSDAPPQYSIPMNQYPQQYPPQQQQQQQQFYPQQQQQQYQQQQYQYQQPPQQYQQPYYPQLQQQPSQATTVVYVQQTPQTYASAVDAADSQLRLGICDCGDGFCCTCILAAFCPCIVFGQNYADAKQGDCFCLGFCFAIDVALGGFLGIPILPACYYACARPDFMTYNNVVNYNGCCCDGCCGSFLLALLCMPCMMAQEAKINQFVNNGRRNP